MSDLTNRDAPNFGEGQGVAARVETGDVDDLARDAPEEIRYTGLGEYFGEVDLEAWDWIHPRPQWRAE